MNTSTRFVLPLIIVVALGVTGCGPSGPPLGTVEGVVTLDGKPLEGAQITFQPQAADTSPSYGFTDEQGRYELLFSPGRPGAEVGEHVVTISTYRNESNGDGTFTQRDEEVPAAYSQEGTETREVVDGAQEINFDLKSEG